MQSQNHSGVRVGEEAASEWSQQRMAVMAAQDDSDSDQRAPEPKKGQLFKSQSRIRTGRAHHHSQPCSQPGGRLRCGAHGYGAREEDRVLWEHRNRRPQPLQLQPGDVEPVQLELSSTWWRRQQHFKERQAFLLLNSAFLHCMVPGGTMGPSHNAVTA